MLISAPKWLYLGEFLADLDETGVKYHQNHSGEQVKALRIEIGGLFEELDDMVTFFKKTVIFESFLGHFWVLILEFICV